MIIQISSTLQTNSNKLLHSLFFSIKHVLMIPLIFQYLKDLKDRGAKIIIGEFYTSSARHIMCEAYKTKMTQKQGFVWFLPGWFDDKWYDIDSLRKAKNKTRSGKPLKTIETLQNPRNPMISLENPGKPLKFLEIPLHSLKSLCIHP